MVIYIQQELIMIFFKFMQVKKVYERATFT